jgi:uncharacterized membrane protein YvlD (DUF360 family)
MGKMGNEGDAMTPTLYGRWQTRWFLLITVGFPITFMLLGLRLLNVSSNPEVYFWVIGYLGFFGIFWDILYDRLQQFMWDHDWPGLFQFFANVAEGVFFLVVNPILLGLRTPGIPSSGIDIQSFVVQYTVVSITIYILSWVIMRLLFPRWRFCGGEWLGKWTK